MINFIAYILKALHLVILFTISIEGYPTSVYCGTSVTSNYFSNLKISPVASNYLMLTWNRRHLSNSQFVTYIFVKKGPTKPCLQVFAIHQQIDIKPVIKPYLFGNETNHEEIILKEFCDIHSVFVDRRYYRNYEINRQLYIGELNTNTRYMLYFVTQRDYKTKENVCLFSHTLQLDCRKDCWDGGGNPYFGKMMYAKNKVPCISWTSRSKYSHYGKYVNYCRRPSEDYETKPWCYVSDTGWDYCNVPACTYISYGCIKYMSLSYTRKSLKIKWSNYNGGSINNYAYIIVIQTDKNYHHCSRKIVVTCASCQQDFFWKKQIYAYDWAKICSVVTETYVYKNSFESNLEIEVDFPIINQYFKVTISPLADGYIGTWVDQTITPYLQSSGPVQDLTFTTIFHNKNLKPVLTWKRPLYTTAVAEIFAYLIVVGNSSQPCLYYFDMKSTDSENKIRYASDYRIERAELTSGCQSQPLPQFNKNTDIFTTQLDVLQYSIDVAPDFITTVYPINSFGLGTSSTVTHIIDLPVKTTVKAEKSNIGILITIIVIVLIGTIFVAALIFYLRKKPNLDEEIYVLSDLEVKEQVPIPQPILLNELKSYLEHLSEDNNKAMNLQFQLLRILSKDQIELEKLTCKVAKKEENASKNRYKSMIPYDQSRVELSQLENITDRTNYINASYVMGALTPDEFIATQGPTPETMTDFWRMIWEQDVSIIVALTRTQGEHSRCDSYWPDAKSKMQLFFGEQKVTITSIMETFHESHLIREFCIEMNQVDLNVTHLQCLVWKDHGVPDIPDFNIFFQKFRHIRTTLPNRSPIVVHCSAGMGRTGTFICIENIVSMIQNPSTEIDIFSIILELRTRRMRAVQNLEQFNFIHKFLVYYCENNENIYQIINNQSIGNDDGVYS